MSYLEAHDIKLKLPIKTSYYQQFKSGAFRPKPRLTFCLDTKS